MGILWHSPSCRSMASDNYKDIYMRKYLEGFLTGQLCDKILQKVTLHDSGQLLDFMLEDTVLQLFALKSHSCSSPAPKITMMTGHLSKHGYQFPLDTQGLKILQLNYLSLFTFLPLSQYIKVLAAPRTTTMLSLPKIICSFHIPHKYPLILIIYFAYYSSFPFFSLVENHSTCSILLHLLNACFLLCNDRFPTTKRNCAVFPSIPSSA